MKRIFQILLLLSLSLKAISADMKLTTGLYVTSSRGMCDLHTIHKDSEIVFEPTATPQKPCDDDGLIFMADKFSYSIYLLHNIEAFVKIIDSKSYEITFKKSGRTYSFKFAD